MMMPSIFGENLFDEWMNFPFERDFFGERNPLYGKHAKNMMKTDVRENENTYELDVDLPGFKKEEINAKLENGYLTITADKSLEKDKTDNKGRYIRQERYSGSMARSFYVGDSIKETDIHAKFEDGILKLSIPKNDIKYIERSNNIQIE